LLHRGASPSSIWEMRGIMGDEGKPGASTR
jgi:hypothetical protein